MQQWSRQREIGPASLLWNKLVTGNLQNCADVKQTSHGPKDARNRIKLHRAPVCSVIFASPELKCELRAKPELIAGEDIVSSTSANIFTARTDGNERRFGRTARLNHNLRARLHLCCPTLDASEVMPASAPLHPSFARGRAPPPPAGASSGAVGTTSRSWRWTSASS